MQIRPYIPEDAQGLEQLLGQIWGDEPHALNYYRFGPDSPPESPRLLRTLVAEDGGRTIGFGTVWTNTFHPHALYLCINVHPAWQRQGFGSQLLKALEAYNRHRMPLQGCTWQTSVDGIRFLERRGFQAVRRTYEPTLDVADVDQQTFRRFEDRCLEAGYRLASVSSLSQTPDHDEKMAALLSEVYTATHRINPPRPMDIKGWAGVLRDDAPHEDTSFVALQGEQYVAMSAAHVDQSDRVTLTWSGVAEGHRQHERDLMLSLTLRQILQAAHTGARVITAEFDSTNPWAMMQLGAFPFRAAPCWVTFQRQVE